MRVFSKKRLLLVGGAVTSVGAAAALLAGATFGLFSSAGVSSGSSNFTAGTVVVGLGGGTTVTCTVNPMSPGDNQGSTGISGVQNATCQYDVKYTGNVRAFMALDIKIAGTPGTPIEAPYNAGNASTPPAAAQGLYDGTSLGLQFTIADGSSVNYMNGITNSDQSGSSQTLVATTGTAAIADLLVTSTPITAATAATHITVSYTLPRNAGNAYNLATSSLLLNIHAVQADNNPLPTSPLCVAGHQCLPSGSFAWS